ncbi:hypothetical protein HYALB_00008468 [Hymenoscyphus albidus]|uniref:Homing endonuclease LAGLIDADG domain-containing protein n=1 Tax=Hymenoscyphus albidus TaxID=595503 RepID=A0A9N9Q6R8_9HELO|nr:hypothetical protein HYALB_00008468 [Hymenoscyphus albidus]
MSQMARECINIIRFTDEGSFLINIHKRSDLILGYSVSLSFKIKLHLKDKELLENISNFFNVGKIYLRKDGYVDYIVNSMKDLYFVRREVIINHFNDYPLITQKFSDYKLFKLVFEYKKREHLGFTYLLTDTDLLKEFVNFFNCGRYSLSSPEAGDFMVTKFEDIYTKIIPFFNKYTLKGSKSLDFYAFNRALYFVRRELIINKAHLTSEGFESIKPIKLGTLYFGRNGDGQFFVSKKGYANFKIVMKKEDTLALNSLKQKFGGSIKEISSGLKYKLAHKKGLIKLVNNVNGLIRNPSKMLQLDKVCKLYGVKFETSKPLTYYNG